MIAALVDAAGIVTNLIVADPAADRAPDGHVLCALPMTTDLLGNSVQLPVAAGWTWTAEGGFRMPDGSTYQPPQALAIPPAVL